MLSLDAPHSAAAGPRPKRCRVTTEPAPAAAHPGTGRDRTAAAASPPQDVQATLAWHGGPLPPESRQPPLHTYYGAFRLVRHGCRLSSMFEGSEAAALTQEGVQQAIHDSVSHVAQQLVQAAVVTQRSVGSVVWQGGCRSSHMTSVQLQGGALSSHMAAVAPVLLPGGSRREAQ